MKKNHKVELTFHKNGALSIHPDSPEAAVIFNQWLKHLVAVVIKGLCKETKKQRRSRK